MANSPNLELDSVRILINRVRDGDQSAHSELVNQIQSYVTMMADRKLNRKLRACVGPSDIVQQTMIKMVNGIDNFEGKSSNEFFGWINKIIENEAFRTRRDLTRQKRDVGRRKSFGDLNTESKTRFDPVESLLTPQSNAIANERIKLFHEALGRLSEDHATVIRLRNLEQLKFGEIAERMGRTLDSVSNLWCRAVVNFQKEIEELDDNSRSQ